MPSPKPADELLTTDTDPRRGFKASPWTFPSIPEGWPQGKWANGSDPGGVVGEIPQHCLDWSRRGHCRTCSVNSSLVLGFSLGSQPSGWARKGSCSPADILSPGKAGVWDLGSLGGAAVLGGWGGKGSGETD